MRKANKLSDVGSYLGFALNFDTGSHYVAQAVLKLVILLPEHP
jgi:hypothetical protein